MFLIAFVKEKVIKTYAQWKLRDCGSCEVSLKFSSESWENQLKVAETIISTPGSVHNTARHENVEAFRCRSDGNRG